MIRPILMWPDPMLSQLCVPVETFGPDLGALADDMFETMYAAPGRGLAAPQVGRTVRLFVMDVAWKDGAPDPMVCVNPEILWACDDTAIGDEQCLSIPDVPMPVIRPLAIRLGWQDATGARFQSDLTGAAARCAQHELDHLNAVTILDRVPPEDRAGFEARHAGARP